MISKTKIIGIIFIVTLLIPILVSADDDFTLKWSTDLNYESDDFQVKIGPISADVTGDGIHEIFVNGYYYGNAPNGRTYCFNGTDGSVLWQINRTVFDPHVAMAIADLDNDGDLELVSGSGAEGNVHTMCYDPTNGSVIWDASYKSQYHHIAIADTDETGYPYVYIVSHDTNPATLTGRLHKLNGTTGSLVAESSVYTWKPCYGGVSIADLEGDGEYEIIVSDRHAGMDGGMPRGVQCFDENLTLLWNVSDVLCSSHPQAIIDVDNDGILDIVTLQQAGGGIYVINGSTHEPMVGKYQDNIPGMSCHTRFPIADIDEDGHLEVIACNDHAPIIWDLTTWTQDTQLPYSTDEPPNVANVIGDSSLEIITDNGTDTIFYNKTYQEISRLTGVVGKHALVSDLDGDGYNEMILLEQSGDLIWYETTTLTSNPPPRTDCHLYSERRMNNPTYVEPIVTNTDPAASSGFESELSVFLIGFVICIFMIILIIIWPKK